MSTTHPPIPLTYPFMHSFDRSRHGSLYDRGRADSYYSRSYDPHWYPNGTYNAPRIGVEELFSAQVAEYAAGYAAGEDEDKKDWSLFD
jgi:hypothetical protein